MGAGRRERARSGRIRRRLPDVLDRPRIQLAPAQDDAPGGVRTGTRAGRDHHAGGDGRAAFSSLQLACRFRARRRAGDELDRHRVETARRALRAQLAARARRDGHPAVPGPGRGRVPDRGADGRRGRRGSVETAGHRRRQGRLRARRDPVLRPEADARLVLHRCPAALAGAVHAQRAAGDPRAGGTDRARRAVVRAGRFSRGHADRGNRVPLPGRRRHQAVPRRPARPVLRQRGHVSEPDYRCGPSRLGSAAADRTGAGQAGPDRHSGQGVSLAAGNGAAHRLLSGAGRRVRDRAAGIEHRSAHPGFDAFRNWCSRQWFCRCWRRRS